MRKLILLAGVAAMAAMPALAEKGGKGGGNGGGQAAKVHGGGQDGGAKAPKVHASGSGGGKVKPEKAQRQAFHGGGNGGGHQAKPRKAERHAQRVDKPAKAFKNERKVFKDSQDRLVRQRFDDNRRADPRAFGDGRFLDGRMAGRDRSCPPGLAKKGNGCLPPGQAKKVFALGDRIQPAWYGAYNVPDRYSSFYQDTQDYYYRYDDEGYIYRVDNRTNLISGLVPLLGGGFAVGQPLPAGYDVYNVPYQYRDDYYDTADSYYRYGDDAIYRVDAESGIIESIVALLAGDLNVGQALPSGYDAYNVPLDYRDEYYDTDEAMYRYADGNIYEVDPKTQIIQAIVEMLV